MRNGNPLYTSKTLDRLWSIQFPKNGPYFNLGHAVIGDVTPQSIAYTARYTIDKLHAKTSDPEYTASGRVPEYVTMSKNPAIGKHFYSRYYRQFLSTDSVFINPKFRSALPRYYDKLYKRYFGYLDSSDFVFGRDSILDIDTRSLAFSPEVIKANRVAKAALSYFDSLTDRLAAREVIARHKLKQAPKREL